MLSRLQAPGDQGAFAGTADRTGMNDCAAQKTGRPRRRRTPVRPARVSRPAPPANRSRTLGTPCAWPGRALSGAAPISPH